MPCSVDVRHILGGTNGTVLEDETPGAGGFVTVLDSHPAKRPACSYSVKLQQ